MCFSGIGGKLRAEGVHARQKIPQLKVGLLSSQSALVLYLENCIKSILGSGGTYNLKVRFQQPQVVCTVPLVWTHLHINMMD